ncbi:pyridoxamine 5'-phosphate oxidase family protein [Nocardiopsis flavescens]|uniref:Pyridoxamine 5'-phosphate oxidase n=1 Tax=Nocardiopsis flavescens TaxID=758803 RepID=A0A1M6WBY2_9ACTN|nr:pyridoxamine 5'-phosphate oxidase family protein [Nocardiopsis flavescens]SHK91076.1 Pyridoxamine 5'-phosphate oxidase [Nocardiopsis flavescens]
MPPFAPEVADVVDSYLSCEFATLAADGTPMAWPTAARRDPDTGHLLVTTSLAYAQKARNVRRDGRVGLLFSDPTGSGLEAPPQVFVSGTATCPERIHTAPDEAAEYWRTLLVRQPHSRGFLRPPGRWLMDWYYMRLFITVVPDRVEVRPPLAGQLDGAAPRGPVPAPGPLGAALVQEFPSAVLGAPGADGEPLLARVRPTATAEGFAVQAPEGAVPGRAALLVHRHDEALDGMRNASVRGALRADGDRWLLVPDRVVEPMGGGRPSDTFRILRDARRATARYLRARGLARPRIAWDRFLELVPDQGRG